MNEISRWARLSSWGLRAAAAGPLLMLAAALVWGLDVGEDLPFFLITAGVAAGASFLVRVERAGLRALGIVLGLAVGVMLFWTAFGLFEPASFFDFVPGVLVLPGALVGLVAGIGALRAHKRGDVSTAADAGERRGLQIAGGLVGALVVLSAILTVAGRETVGDDVEVDATVELADFEFGEDAYSFTPGTRVLVRNTDPFLHTFTIDDLDIDVEMGPSSEKVVTIPESASGDFVLYCVPHTSDADDPADDDMAAELSVG